MAYKNSLGFSKIGKNTTATESLQLTTAEIGDAKVLQSLVIPTTAPAPAARVNGSVYYDIINNRLMVYESQGGGQWIQFTGLPAP